MTHNEATVVDVNQLLLHAAAAGDLDLALAAIEKGAERRRHNDGRSSHLPVR